MKKIKKEDFATMKKMKETRREKALLFLLILAFLIRIYKLSALMPFYGDVGRDFLVAKEIVTKHVFPLFGPLLLADIIQKKFMMAKFLVWTPYRALSFFSILTTKNMFTFSLIFLLIC